MPILVFAVGLFVFWIGILTYTMPGVDSDKPAGAKMMVVGGALLAWLVWSASAPTRFSESTTITTFDHEGASVVIYDGELYNMNAKFEQNIPAGVDIYARSAEPGWYGGIHWSVSDKQFKLTPFDHND